MSKARTQVSLLLGFHVGARLLLLLEFRVQCVQTLEVALLLPKVKHLSFQRGNLEVLVVILGRLL
jgi:hypothetical protein